MLSVELMHLSENAKHEISALCAHFAWAGMDLAYGGNTRWIPDEEDFRSSVGMTKTFIADPSSRVIGSSHTRWMAAKLHDGWSQGPVRDNDAKIHPDLVPFKQLPEESQLKDKCQVQSQKAIMKMLGLLE